MWRTHTFHFIDMIDVTWIIAIERKGSLRVVRIYDVSDFGFITTLPMLRTLLFFKIHLLDF